MDEQDLRLAGIRSPEEEKTTKSSTTQRTIIKPAWLTNVPGLRMTASSADSLPGTNIERGETQQEGEPPKKDAAAKKIRKRKISTTSTPRNNRSRTRNSSAEETEDTMAGSKDILEEIRKINVQFGGLREEIKNDVSAAVGQVTAQVKQNSENIAKIQNDLDKKISSSVEETVSRELRKYGIKDLRVRNEGDDTQRNYWRCRRSVRCWPITGPEQDLWGLTGDFFAKILGIPNQSLPQDAVESIRRISRPRSKRMTKIQNEVLVTFKEVATRDLVFSYAPNLANYRQAKEPPGIRLEYPDHLRGTFSTLEKYGIMMKSRLGSGFKRSIKFDDSAMSLRIDVCLPGEERWTQIAPEIATEEVGKMKRRETEETRNRLGSLSGVDGPAAIESRPSTSAIQLPRSATLTEHFVEAPSARWGSAA